MDAWYLQRLFLYRIVVERNDNFAILRKVFYIFFKNFLFLFLTIKIYPKKLILIIFIFLPILKSVAKIKYIIFKKIVNCLRRNLIMSDANFQRPIFFWVPNQTPFFYSVGVFLVVQNANWKNLNMFQRWNREHISTRKSNLFIIPTKDS